MQVGKAGWMDGRGPAECHPVGWPPHHPPAASASCRWCRRSAAPQTLGRRRGRRTAPRRAGTRSAQSAQCCWRRQAAPGGRRPAPPSPLQALLPRHRHCCSCWPPLPGACRQPGTGGCSVRAASDGGAPQLQCAAPAGVSSGRRRAGAAGGWERGQHPRPMRPCVQTGGTATNLNGAQGLLLPKVSRWQPLGRLQGCLGWRRCWHAAGGAAGAPRCRAALPMVWRAAARSPRDCRLSRTLLRGDQGDGRAAAGPGGAQVSSSGEIAPEGR